jgi:hypothetical protein
MSSGFNETQQSIGIPVDTGAFTAIFADGPVRGVTIVGSRLTGEVASPATWLNEENALSSPG